ncbi:hypothetical protein NQ314_013848 [Rhamnusium bicolor]|uniref:Uncharacterized protein n=1 Tax=Rhamnusium bicolor TaxID=1586634 RepID=A0AAV8X5M8_9CUCU|nr:hypothetical protein NQ314_013848 [Rhamnusium bicolor]
MPPFRLELPDRKSLDNRSKTTLYFKRTYNKGVKVAGWEKYQECQPIDTDPYCPTAYNTHYSHYNQLGGDDKKLDYSTSTKDMLEQLFTRRHDLEINPKKDLVNLYSKIDNTHLADNTRNKACSAAFSEEYITTMQHSYQPPYPFELERLSMPETPYFLNRHLTNTGICKFLDDDFVLQTKRLQKYKSHKCISYNPYTGHFTDGSL